MSIEKIKLTKGELLEKLEDTFNQLNIKHNNFDKDKNPMQINIERDSKKSVLRIYLKKDGFKIDTSVGANKELNVEVENSFKDFEVTEQKTYCYKNIDTDTYTNIKQRFQQINNSQIIPRDNNDPNKEDFFEIRSNLSNERINVSKFKSGTLMLQGIVWNLWEDVCEIIDTSRNSSIEDIINRFSFGESSENEDYSEEISNVKDIITDEVYGFLDDHYQDYLISAQCILNSDIKMKEFSTVLCPTAKVLEGFLKKILISLRLEDLVNMEDNWHFGKVFYNSNENPHIIYRHNSVRLSSEKEADLFDLYDAVKFYRHDLNHGSPKPKTIVKEKSIAVSIYNEILNKIKLSYYNILK